MEERQAQSAATQTTVAEALDRHDREQFLERFRDIDIKGEDADKIMSELGLEFAGIYAIANEDDSDYRRHLWLNRNRRERARSDRNPGRLCEGDILQLARGTHKRPDTESVSELTKRERRQMYEAFEARTALNSLGKGGEGLSAVSEVTAVTEHRRQTEPDDEGGSSSIIGRIFS